jgi:hypothetical protein
MTYMRDVAERLRAELADRLPPDDADDLLLIYAVLLRAKGEAVSAEDVHDAWTAWKEIRGEAHPSAIPFAELPATVQAQDEPFVQAIRSVAAAC